jgi:uncharacterized protein YaaN involved in tellurite resistance
MASTKTSKRTYKKRSTKKVSKGGNVMCDVLCNGNKKSNEEEVATEQVDDADEPEEPEEPEEPKEEETDDADEVKETDDADEVTETDDADDKKIFGFGKGGKKSRKNKGHKKLRKTAKKPKSAWTKFVTELYKKNKMKNPIYMFKDALKDAAKIYRK